MYSGSGSGDYYRSGRGSSGGRDRYSERSERERVPSRYRSPSPDRYRSSGGSSRYDRSPPSRRRSPSPRYRSSGSSRYRSPSPGPSYSRHGGGSSSRDSRRRDSSSDRHDKHSSKEKERRDRSSDEQRRVPTAEDNRNVLERMEKSFTDGPLDALKRSVKDGIKVKVWTRNYKEVRGICTGFVVAFDKHWNIIMKDVDEVYLKPRKSKTPFLRELRPGESDAIPEMAPRAPKEKKKKPAESGEKEADDTPMDTDKAVKETVQSESGSIDASKGEGEAPAVKPKKRRRKKRKTPIMCKRHIPKVFIRGDNVVMVALTSDSDSKPEQSGEEEEAAAE